MDDNPFERGLKRIDGDPPWHHMGSHRTRPGLGLARHITSGRLVPRNCRRLQFMGGHRSGRTGRLDYPAARQSAQRLGTAQLGRCNFRSRPPGRTGTGRGHLQSHSTKRSSRHLLPPAASQRHQRRHRMAAGRMAQPASASPAFTGSRTTKTPGPHKPPLGMTPAVSRKWPSSPLLQNHHPRLRGKISCSNGENF